MKKFFSFALIFFMAIGLGACGSKEETQKPTVISQEQKDKLGDRYNFEDGKVSMQLPKGWDEQDVGLKYVAFVDKKNQNANINLTDEKADMSLDQYKEATLKSLEQAFKDLKIVKEEKFVTESGIEGYKFVIDNKQNGVSIQQVLYLFDVGDGNKMVITGTSLGNSKDEMLPLFDASVSTFEYKK